MNAEPTTTLYVVNMLYRIEDEITRNDVSARVASKLNLSSEQVYKLLSRPPGRMIKPATLERAELIANAFIGVGVPVEVVKADAGNAAVLLETPEPVQAAAWEAPATPLTTLPATLPAAPLLETPAPPAVVALSPALETSQAAPVQRRRSSLAAKVLSVTVLPRVIVGLSLIAYLQTQLTQESVRLEKQHAQEVIQTAIGGLGAQTSAADLARVLRSPVAFVDYSDAQGSKTFVARDTKNQAAIQTVLAQLETAQPVQVQTGGELGAMRVPELPNETFQIHAASILTDANGSIYVKFADTPSVSAIPATAKPSGTAVFGFESKGFQLTQQLVNTVGFIMLAIAIVTLISQVFARQLIDPIVKLTRTADRLSLGELDVPVSAATNDEMGDLAEALERMRLSLKSAIERLRRRR